MLRKLAIALSAAILPIQEASAQTNRSPGVTDSEIVIGQTMPFSGPASAYSAVGRSMAAYFAKVNAEGGVNGRKINLIALDDGFSPPKTVEQTRRLVEQDNVLGIFASLGTATNTAIQKYLNARKVPHLFVQSGAGRWNDPTHFPWSMPGLPDYVTEARAYATYVLAHKPGARIAVLYQNDDFGRDYLKGLREGLGEQAAKMVVGEQSYEITDPSIDSQVIALAGSGADTFLIAGTQKATSQALRKAYDLSWRPLTFVSSISASRTAVLKPAGLEASMGVISASFVKDPTDAQWHDDPGYKAWLSWMKQYYPSGNLAEQLNVSGFVTGALMVDVLKRSGNSPTREKVMEAARTIPTTAVQMLLPGITASTSPGDYRLFKQSRMVRFDGERWALLGQSIVR